MRDLDDLGRMLDALPGHVRDVQQAVDSPEVHERAVVGQVLDHSLDDVAFLQVVEQGRALRAVLLFDDCAPGHDHVVALLVELDHLEFERLALEIGGIADGPHVDEGAGQEGPDVFDLDGEATLDAAVDHTADDFPGLERLLEAGPGTGALRLFTRQSGRAGTVLDGIERNLDLVARGNLDLAGFILELIRRDDCLGLESDADDDHVGRDADDGTVQYLAGADLLAGQTLFEQLGKGFCHVVVGPR